MQEAAAGAAREQRRSLRLRGNLAKTARHTRRWRAKRQAHRNEVLLVQARVRAFVHMLERM